MGERRMTERRRDLVEHREHSNTVVSTRHAGDHEDVMVRERPIHSPRPAVRTRTSPQSILCPSPAPDSPSTAS